MEEYKPTLTLLELYKDLRACGIKTSTPKIKAMIQQGKYADFAVSCEMKDTEYEIYTMPYKRWKKRKGLKGEI